MPCVNCFHSSLLAPVKTSGVNSAKLKHDINLLLERVNSPSSQGQMCKTWQGKQTGRDRRGLAAKKECEIEQDGRMGGHLLEMSTVYLLFTLMKDATELF